LLQSSFTLEPEGPGAPRRVLLRLSGDADLRQRDALDGWRRGLAHPVDVHVDLADLAFAGAAFLGWLVRLADDVQGGGGRLTLGPVPARLGKLLVVCGLDARFAALLREGVRRVRRDAAPSSER
jgi:anti-anti-sigma regulatory factor